MPSDRAISEMEAKGGSLPLYLAYSRVDKVVGRTFTKALGTTDADRSMVAVAVLDLALDLVWDVSEVALQKASQHLQRPSPQWPTQRPSTRAQSRRLYV